MSDVYGIVDPQKVEVTINGRTITIALDKSIPSTMVGHELTEDELVERVTAAVKLNGETALVPVEPQQSTSDPIIPPVVPPVVPHEGPNGEIGDLGDEPVREPENEKEEKRKPGFKALRFIPIALLIPLLALAIKSCAREKEIPEDINPKITITTETTGIHEEIYDVDNPGTEEWLMSGAYGQEGQVANDLYGDDQYNGPYYNWEEQLIAEGETSNLSIYFEDMKKNIDAQFSVLGDDNATMQDKMIALNEIMRLENEANTIYLENQEAMQTYIEKFKTATEAYPDVNTESEEQTADNAYAEYLNELGLSDLNVESLNNIKSLLNSGWRISDITSERTPVGYTIDGEAMRTVVVQTDPEKNEWTVFNNWLHQHDKPDYTKE